jgi:putative transposase
VHIESFNARLREECLNEHVFVSLDDARIKIEKRRIQYNRERPHSNLGNLTAEEFAAQAADPVRRRFNSGDARHGDR